MKHHTLTIPLLVVTILILTSISITADTNETTTTPLLILQPLIVDSTNTQGPWNGTPEHPYQHIQDAIQNATPYQSILVRKGLYTETITINKPLTIIGENKTTTIIDGDYHPIVCSITADNVTIQEFTICNSSGYQNNAGIFTNSEQTIISNCIFYRTKTGIYLNGTSETIINNCRFQTNGEGIALYSSTHCTILDSCFSHNGLGLTIEQSDHITIQGCYAHTNGIGYFINNAQNITIDHCAAYNNNDNQAGVFLGYSHDITISQCNINHNGFGVQIANSTNINISSSDLFWNTHFAVKIEKNSTEILVTSCDIEENLRFGVYVENSECSVLGNNIYHNLFGMNAENSLCNAKYNWWGSRLGPAKTEHLLRDQIKFENGRIQVFPWAKQKNTNTGSDWNIDQSRCPDDLISSYDTPIQLPDQDSDADKIPDWWETKYGYNPYQWDDHEHLDPDHDGLNNIEECYTDHWGSNPYQKDIFLEFDWMESQASGNPVNKPSRTILEEVTSLFKDHGIQLHVDLGDLGGGEIIPYQSHFSYADLRDIYWNYFLHNDLNNPRKGVFHYAVVCDYGPGSGFTFIGWDQLDSFCISAQTLQEKQPSFERDILIVGGAIHELGHTLGIIADDFGGVDNMVTLMFLSRQQIKYLSYQSCMNYFYTYKILGYSDGSRGRNDFDDWGNLDFSFFKQTHFEWPKN
ncbi:MAG: right-handed parallel beta-helix repeat-containing protein [Methanobacteriota archaeon]